MFGGPGSFTDYYLKLNREFSPEPIFVVFECTFARVHTFFFQNCVCIK